MVFEEIDNKDNWFDVDERMPNSMELVKVKVADYTEDYITTGYYNERCLEWYSDDHLCLDDLVYEWRPL